ncbi:MAG: FG-GAP-like repeat-containing protein [Verrucomicrobiales bacterium]|nr:FG-GAP-like repeat-containing protein [Verrucomicrobiales bacterium]
MEGEHRSFDANQKTVMPTSRKFFLLATLPLVISTVAADQWKTTSLLSDFYAEGAGVGDLNGDGKVDITYGPFWFAGPDFQKQTRFADGEPFDGGSGYSDNFFSFVRDFNADGKNDILVFGFPGKSARLYLNSDQERWEMVEVADQVANESPHLVDLIPGGHPEIVCAREKAYGYFEASDDATKPWTWHAISPTGEAATPFGHGLGVGDINGDGRADVIEKMHWYEQPEDGSAGPWKKHKWALIPYGGGGSQILIDDLDQDGDNDIITSLNAHGYGIAWFKQHAPGKFSRHNIVGESSTENPYGVAFSQPHALALADMDGDGRNDFVTGKRYFAHQGRDPGGLQEAVLYWFRNTEKDGAIDWVPHLVDHDSGVGVEVKVTDLDGDQKPDIVTSSKKGLLVHTRIAGGKISALPKWSHGEHLPQDQYKNNLSPEEAREQASPPDGFTIDLIAAEPVLTQPIAMTFDARGRIWVIEGHTYPVRDEGNFNEGKDRILIFEDADSNGSFETRKVFAENINLASGIEIGFGGVYVGAAPYLLFYPDKDQNDQPDGEPEILLDGWGWQDTHETLNAFTWGPDGWLYGCHGVFTHSKVGKPGTPDEQRIPINAGVWRFHPVSKEFEVYAHGTSNPWGVDFNEYGDFFVSACVIPHFYHLSHGGRYFRQAGQHFDPFTFDDIKTIADHSHYTGNMRILWTEWRGNKGDEPEEEINFTNTVGGGHAHCGLVYYDAPEFPASYRRQMYFHNLHGHRIVREDLGVDGSGYLARHRPDFLLTNNHDTVGVGVMQGPDGALYYSDWVDGQTCHHRDVEAWDRSNGRIFRVRHGDAKTTALDLPERDDEALVALLASENTFHARQAQRLLQERAAVVSLDHKAVAAALTEFENEHSRETPFRLRALWTRHVTGTVDEKHLMAALSDPDEHIRGWAIQIAVANEGTLPRLIEMSKTEESLVVRRYLASKLQTLPLEQRWELARGLIAHGRSERDRNIPYLTWYGIAPLVEADPGRALELVSRTSWPMLKDFLTRRAAVFPEGRSAIMDSLSKAQMKDWTGQANQLLTALESLPPVERPDGWEEAKKQGRSFSTGHGQETLLRKMGARFGDPEFFPHWRTVARNEKTGPGQRIEALELLTVGRDPELGALARELLPVAPLRPAAIAALRRHPGSETANAIVAVLPGLPLKQRNEAINLLASRPEMALALLEAVDGKKLESSLVSPVMLDQFERFENEKITALIDKNWLRGGGGVDIAGLTAAIEEWKKKLNPKVMAKADASRGRQTYTMTCGTCHQLFGEGIALGPDLTGSNRADLAYLLENVLAPSSVVGREYLLNIFTMKDGSTISGMVKAETPEFVTVSMPGGTDTDVKITEIKERQQMAQSLMPAGLFDTMKIEQVADLVKYLASSQQVPLPGEKKPVSQASEVPPPAKGVTRIEAESLVENFAPKSGQLRPQGMSNFGPAWSGSHQLWWTGAQPGDILTLKLEGLKPGNHNLVLFPTTAKDYAQVKIAINGQLREVDFYTETVLPGEPIRFENVNISPSEPLQIDVHITGKNPEALPSYMVGIDRIEVK